MDRRPKRSAPAFPYRDEYGHQAILFILEGYRVDARWFLAIIRHQRRCRACRHLVDEADERGRTP